MHIAPQENLGPSEDDDSEFARELAKLLTDASAESRKVDKKTALALWDSAVLPPAARKKRAEHELVDGEEGGPGVMSFTLVTKRGNKQQVRVVACTSCDVVLMKGFLGRPARWLFRRRLLSRSRRALPRCRTRRSSST